MMVVILCSSVVGGISIWHLKTVSDQNSAQIMNLSCREEGKKLEHIFYSVEQSVKIIAHNATKNNRMDKIIQDDYLRVMYMEEMRPILLAAAKSTEGAVAVYYHLNPEIAPSDAGLFYSKTLFSQNFLVQKVTDLAKAHILALKYLIKGGKSDVFNLGNGKGYSVLEIIETARKVTNHSIPTKTVERRTGDPARLVASNEKAKEILGWQPEITNLKEIITHS